MLRRGLTRAQFDSRGPAYDERRIRATVAVPLCTGLVMAAVFGVTLLLASRAGDDVVERSADEVGRATHSVASREMFDHLYDLDVPGMEAELANLVLEENITYAAVRDASGSIVARQADGRVPEPQVASELAVQSLAQGARQDRHLGRYELSSGPIAVDSEQIGTLEIVFDREHGQAVVGTMQRTLLLYLLPLLVGTVLAAVLLTRLATRPLVGTSARLLGVAVSAADHRHADAELTRFPLVVGCPYPGSVVVVGAR